MILLDFLDRVKAMGIFSVTELELLFPGLDGRRLYEWHKKGYIIKLRNGWYCLPEFLKEHYSTWIIANVVHEPSYISLESALNYYGLIPEAVYLTTSVSTKRTLRLSMAGSSYAFSSIKKELFFGYVLMENDSYKRKFRIAEPEKALIDFLYLHPEYSSYEEIDELRLNRPVFHDIIHTEKLRKYLMLFRNRKLEKRTSTVLQLMDHA